MKRVKHTFRNNMNVREHSQRVDLYEYAKDQLRLIHMSVPKKTRDKLSDDLAKILDLKLEKRDENTNNEKTCNTTQKYKIQPKHKAVTENIVSPQQVYHAKKTSIPLNTKGFVPSDNSSIRESNPKSKIISNGQDRELNAAYIDQIVDDFMKRL